AVVLVLAATVLGGCLAATSAGGQGQSPFDRMLGLLTDPNFGLAEIKREIRAIEEKVTTPAPGPLKLSSGLFGLPAAAQSVDWMVLNDSTTPQTVTVTVFKAGVGPKTSVAPGALTLTLAPGEVTHNANSVGFGQPFVPGFYYEVVVEASNPNVLPSVHVWQDHGNPVIPGTLIPPGDWVRLQ